MNHGEGLSGAGGDVFQTPGYVGEVIVEGTEHGLVFKSLLRYITQTSCSPEQLVDGDGSRRRLLIFLPMDSLLARQISMCGEHPRSHLRKR